MIVTNFRFVKPLLTNSKKCKILSVQTNLADRERGENQKWVAAGEGGVLLKAVDQLPDKQIAQRLRLDEEVVRRIRCMAEWDLPLEAWQNAAAFTRRSRLKQPLGGPRRDVNTEPSQSKRPGWAGREILEKGSPCSKNPAPGAGRS